MTSEQIFTTFKVGDYITSTEPVLNMYKKMKILKIDYSSNSMNLLVSSSLTGLWWCDNKYIHPYMKIAYLGGE